MTENQVSNLPHTCQATALTSESPCVGKVFFLPIEPIMPPKLGKKPLNQNKLIRTISSLRQYGFAKPLLVQKSTSDSSQEGYIALGGEEYLRAAALVGIEKLPCILAQNPPDHTEIEHILLQIRQKQGDMFTQAAAFRYLIEQYHMTQQEIAESLEISQSTVANKLRLLQFSPTEQEEIRRLRLSERHARALLRLQAPKMRLQALSVLQQEQLTVKDTEGLVERFLELSGGKKGPFEEQEALWCPPNAPFGASQAQPNRGSATYGSFGEAHAPRCFPESPADGGGLAEIAPRRFILKTLQPLYNSLENALAIFRKTGKSAIMTRAEGENGVFITIHIPF